MEPRFQVTFDCADPAVVAAFWAALLGYEMEPPPEGYASWPDFLAAIGVPESEWNRANAISDPTKERPRIFFQRVPEPKTVKNRVHVDVNVGGGPEVPIEERRGVVDEAVARATALGARTLWTTEGDNEYCVTMADPEGNEYCLQ